MFYHEEFLTVKFLAYSFTHPTVLLLCKFLSLEQCLVYLPVYVCKNMLACFDL